MADKILAALILALKIDGKEVTIIDPVKSDPGKVH